MKDEVVINDYLIMVSICNICQKGIMVIMNCWMLILLPYAQNELWEFA